MALVSGGNRHKNIPDHSSHIATMGLVTQGFIHNVRIEVMVIPIPLPLFDSDLMLN